MAATEDSVPRIGEFEVLARLRRRLANGPAQSAQAGPTSQASQAGPAGRHGPAGQTGVVGPAPGEVFSGDDTAVLIPPVGPLLLAIDLVVEGVHFDLGIGSLADAGWKAISVNASDIAAMGGRPLHVVVGVAAPPETDLDELTEGMLEACSAYEIALVGGDLTSGDQLMVSVAITGTCDSRDPVLRSGAHPGDVIWVTGSLGASAAGLQLLRGRADPSRDELVRAYRRPQARVREGRVAATSGATAMIDVSDGLSRDLDHIARESGVGIRLSSVPVVAGASLEQALGGGEDYELVFTASEGAGVTEGFAAAGLAAPIRIGTCSDDAGERSLAGEPLVVTGWEHSFRNTRGRLLK